MLYPVVYGRIGIANDERVKTDEKEIECETESAEKR